MQGGQGGGDGRDETGGRVSHATGGKGTRQREQPGQRHGEGLCLMCLRSSREATVAEAV